MTTTATKPSTEEANIVFSGQSKLRAVIMTRQLPIDLYGRSSKSRYLRKLVHLYLASCANPNGTNCYPGQTKTARECGLTVRGLQNIIAWLLDHSLLEKADDRSELQTVNYTVKFSAEDISACREALAADEQEKKLAGTTAKTRAARQKGALRAKQTRLERQGGRMMSTPGGMNDEHFEGTNDEHTPTNDEHRGMNDEHFDTNVGIRTTVTVLKPGTVKEPTVLGGLAGWTRTKLVSKSGHAIRFSQEAEALVHSLAEEFGPVAYVAGMLRFLNRRAGLAGFDFASGVVRTWADEIRDYVTIIPGSENERDTVAEIAEEHQLALAEICSPLDGAELMAAMGDENLDALRELLAELPQLVQKMDNSEVAYAAQ